MKRLPQILKYILPFVSLALILAGTYVAIRYAKGDRPTLKGVQGTGLLAATSDPQGAQVFINGKLTTATDDTLNLSPGSYEVEIKKEGFFSWKKQLTIKEEVVTQTNTSLFPSVVSLTPLTFSGAKKVVPSPDGQKIAFLVENAQVLTQNGLYVLELSDTPLTLRSSPRQIAKSTIRFNLGQATYVWSPDSSQLLLHFTAGDNLLIETNKLNDLDNTPDSTARLTLLLADWERQLTLDWNQKLLKLPDEMQQIATESAKNVYFSPDEKKMLYTATQTATIPEELVPELVGSSTQPEERDLEVGSIYVYDFKEDRNFKIGAEVEPPAELGTTLPIKPTLLYDPTLIANNLDASPAAFLRLQTGKKIDDTLAGFNAQYSPLALNTYQWFPNSYHLLKNTDLGITINEYDGTNSITIYSGPRDATFVYPWPNGSKLIILTNLGNTDDTPMNLYAISLK